jgi:hypothetical protein
MRRRGLAILAGAVCIAIVPSSFHPATAATPRAGNQCKKREVGTSRGALTCSAVGGRFIWQRSTQNTTASSCDPNYSPCVPIASDVDCAGGTGNGPAYVAGPIRVIGTDIYGLDRDGDGVACEPK